ncbi:hypothetical protein ACVK00_002143 [Burkholderia sp. PvR073]|uniref:hypothetical protein n=1 Tax=Burkholderia TaxID=32008 RepID=UPI00254F8359|nr:hypothetical protein [Burkholderia sp. lyk4-R2A-23]
MALHLIDSNDVHVSCRQRMEACELWLRRIIHDKFIERFGNNYIDGASLGGQAIFSNKIRSRVQSFVQNNPGQYSRPIDTLLLDDLGSVLSKDDVYKEFFKVAFDAGFPMGANHVRQVITILVPIRNALSHANAATLSLHDAERSLCYCNDIIASLKKYYSDMASQDKFPAPVFTRYSDSLGTVWHPAPPSDHRAIGQPSLHVGEDVRFEVEVDSSFDPSEYEITWQVCNISQGETGKGSAFNLTLTSEHVGQRFALQVSLKTKKDWHRLQNVDAYLTLDYEVLPFPG